MIYADYAATTPLDDEVLRAIAECPCGNPSSTHAFGRQAAHFLEEARQTVACVLGADKNEIYFTSGGTESDNWALCGVARRSGKKRIITSAIEHHAILHTCQRLEDDGFAVTRLPVDRDGILHPETLENAVDDDTALISVMAANNEIGTVEPLSELAMIAHAHHIPFHTDAVQAVGTIPFAVHEDHIDLLSLSAHKFYGPKGVGVLYVRNGIGIENLMQGGAQERDRRPGTVNVPGAVGLAKALQKQWDLHEERSAHARMIADKIFKGITAVTEGVTLNGSPEHRLPGNLNLSFEGVSAESLLLLLDLKGVCVSAGAACSAGALKKSHVLEAIGASGNAIRISVSHLTTFDEAVSVIRAVNEAVHDIRKA